MADLVLATHLRRLPIGTEGQRSDLGRVLDVVIDAKTGRFLGLTFSKNLFGHRSFVVFADILFVDRGGVVVNDSKNIHGFDEFLKQTKHKDHGTQILGKKVYTKSGKKLGRLEDVTLSLVMGAITQLHISGFIGSRIISAHKLVDIQKKKIIVEDEFEDIPSIAPQVA